MGKKGANMVAREPSANIKMEDLGTWWKDISATHAVRLQVTWELTGFDELAMWRFTVRAFRCGQDEGSAPYDVKSLVWPTASHKTVLGALLWLLMTVDDQLDATEALAARISTR